MIEKAEKAADDAIDDEASELCQHSKGLRALAVRQFGAIRTEPGNLRLRATVIVAAIVWREWHR